MKYIVRTVGENAGRGVLVTVDWDEATEFAWAVVSHGGTVTIETAEERR